MFAALIAFVLVTICAAKDLPSYIHVCGRNDPNYNQCIIENIKNIKPKICTGMPEFNNAPVEPIIIDEIIIYDTDNLKLSIQDGKITGFCNFEIQSVNINPDKTVMEFEVLFTNLKLDSLYNFDIRVLVQLANKGIVHISSEKLKGIINLELKEVTKDNKKQLYVAKVNTKLDVQNFDYEFDDTEKDLVQLHEVMRNTISENEKDIIEKVRPILEQVVSKKVILIVNNIFINRYEQLFPDEAP